MKLTALGVRHLITPGTHAYGGGLYLQVRDAAHRSWLFRYARAGRTRWMGLGSLSDVSLTESRQRADEARRLLREGKDPIAECEAARAAPRRR